MNDLYDRVNEWLKQSRPYKRRHLVAMALGVFCGWTALLGVLLKFSFWWKIGIVWLAVIAFGVVNYVRWNRHLERGRPLTDKLRKANDEFWEAQGGRE
jgi:hypothetical protein